MSDEHEHDEEQFDEAALWADLARGDLREAQNEDELAVKAELLAEKLSRQPAGEEAAGVARESAAVHRALAAELRRSADEARKAREDEHDAG